MRRAFVVLAAALLGIALFTGGLAWLLNDPRPPAGASRGERLYYAHCVECHGRDGRGSWRAALFLLRPGDLGKATRMTSETDRYLFDIVKNGGSPLGRPGMPAFGYFLSEADIQELVRYLRTLGTTSRAS
jgi:mono/diheme cytochrome c family protein